MNGDLRTTDDLIREMFKRRSRRGSMDGLRASVLAATVAAPQRRRWSIRRVDTARPPLRLLAIAALLVGVTGIGLLAVAQQPAPRPPLHMAGFVPAFDYQPVEGVQTDTPVRQPSIIGFTTGGGTDDVYPRDDEAKLLPGAHGIAIVRIDTPAAHGCTGPRDPIRTDPVGFIEDIGTRAGAGIGETTPITFDGRPALQVDIDPARATCEYADVHTFGTGIGSDYALLNMPSRLIVTDVDGTTVMLQVWAATSEELEAWLPTATTFLEGIHFTGDTYP